MATPLPLPTLLSQTLVAITIELDNEAEHRLPHHTTSEDDPAARRDGPWLISYALWANALQYVDEDGITVAELRTRARTGRLQLNGLRRWGYVTLTPPPGEALGTPPQDETVVRATPAAQRARPTWSGLAAVIAARWRTRFGDDAVTALLRSLRVPYDALPFDPPAYLPLVHPTQNGRTDRPDPEGRPSTGDPDLIELLAGVLFAFTLDYESAARISLPIGANTLRVLDPAGVRVRDLPRMTGVSKEGNAMCVGWLERHGCAVTEPDPAASRGKVVRLTPKGERAQAKHARVTAQTESGWRQTHGPGAVDALRGALTVLVGDGLLASSLLARGLEPYPDNWRAGVRRPETLPHFPLVLHRGGYPDGS